VSVGRSGRGMTGGDLSSSVDIAKGGGEICSG
jgi:hypothetical protein